MKISILDHLVCPSCHSELKLKTKKRIKNEIIDGTLICTKCNDKFKVQRLLDCMTLLFRTKYSMGQLLLCNPTLLHF